MEFAYSLAKESDSEAIYEIMQEAERGLENKEDFVSDSLDFIKRHIKKEGFIVLAKYGEKPSEIAGFFIIRFPREEEDNLGNDLGLKKEEKDRVVHMESAAVLPTFRGRGLQAQMLKFALEKLKPSSICLATVSPQNKASLSSFLKEDFHIVLTKEKYQGKLRHILYKVKY